MRKRTRIVVVAVAALLAIPMVAIAADRFNDVPDTNIFHDDIAWLADAGVTAGCNPPANDEFCPEDAVKRQQMAAFMRRFAQYLGAEDGIVSEADNAATAGDADTLDDYNASDTRRVVRRSGRLSDDFHRCRLDRSRVRCRHGPCRWVHSRNWHDLRRGCQRNSRRWQSPTAAGNRLGVTLRHVRVPGCTDEGRRPDAETGAITNVVPVTAGDHTVALQGRETWLRSCTPVDSRFSPFGRGVAIPAAAVQSGARQPVADDWRSRTGESWASDHSPSGTMGFLAANSQR